MRSIKLALLVVSVFMLAAAAASAADRFGMAGCGLGSLAFGDDSGKVSQILAATTNGTSGTQTFGITSGTSNCDPKSGPAGAKLFIETNREALAKDISRGSGETVASLSALVGCPDAGQVGRTLQQNFGTIFPNANVSDEQVSGSVLGVLGANAQLECNRLQ